MTRFGRGCPSGFLLRSALLVAGCMGASGTSVSAARGAYRALPTSGLYTPDDLERGEGLLLESGLLSLEASQLVPAPELLELCALPPEEGLRLLLIRYLQQCPPIWLPGATRGPGLQEELIPDEDVRNLHELLMDAEEREAFLLTLGRRFDQEQARALGDTGEQVAVRLFREELQRLGRPELAAAVRRVSLLSDQLGYDLVVPTLEAGPWRIEVKAIRGLREELFLSRNEARVGLRDPRWRLLVCRVEASGGECVGWCSGAALEPLLPRDPPGGGCWESVRLTLEQVRVTPGLPPLADA
ncbi:MAG: protein NO VEIN domain-containing protein [Hyalangium sp.]|uniref:protein NO VEIN domain-containing protein n=1 Tax=Hyalangium sp. TaxID=2028555 RepID=UPI00389A1037